MLREVKNAGWTRRLTLLGWRYEFVTGRTPCASTWRKRVWQSMAAHQHDAPLRFLEVEGRAYWWFEDGFYWEDEGFEVHDVLALVRERERRRKRKLERAHMALALDHEPVQRRAPVTREVRLAVFERDGGRCVECGSAFDLQYDHLIPVAMGGATSVENLRILCAECNQRKGATLG